MAIAGTTSVSLQLNDGLDLSLPIAGPGARAYAFLLDFKFRTMAALLWMGVGGLIYSKLADKDLEKVFEHQSEMFMAVIWVPVMVIYFLYHPVLEYFMGGRTPGKRIAGLRLVDQFGRAPSFQQIVIRNVFRLTDSLPFFYVFGLSVCFASPQRLRAGDYAAGTYLVHDALKLKAIQKTLATRVQASSESGHLELAHWEFAHALMQRWKGLLPSERLKLAQHFFKKVVPEQPVISNAELAYQQLCRLAGGKHQKAKR
jgi:uncharacterized RDD family membrane protein YckC